MVSFKTILLTLFAAATQAQDISLYRWNGAACSGDEGVLHQIPENTCIYFPLSGDNNGPSPSIQTTIQSSSEVGCRFTVTTANSCGGKKFHYRISKNTQCASLNTTTFPNGIIGTEWTCGSKKGGADLEPQDELVVESI